MMEPPQVNFFISIRSHSIIKMPYILQGAKSMRIYVLGNGESRRSFDLSSLKDEITIGCNAIYRDFAPTLLVAGDSPITKEIRENYKGDFLFRDGKNKRFVWENPIGNRVLVEAWPWTRSGFSWYAGVAAAWAAASWEGASEVHLVGFDSMLPSHGKTVNNMYKDTRHYCASDVAQNMALNVKQSRNSLMEVISRFPKIKFILAARQP